MTSRITRRSRCRPRTSGAGEIFVLPSCEPVGWLMFAVAVVGVLLQQTRRCAEGGTDMCASSSRWTFLIAVGVLLCSACGPASRPKTLPPLQSAETLTETDVLPHIEGAITPGRNYVYCPTFQMAWDELCDGVIKSPPQLAGDPPMAAILNRTELPELGLEDSSFFAKAGLAKGGVLSDIGDLDRNAGIAREILSRTDLGAIVNSPPAPCRRRAAIAGRSSIPDSAL